LNATAPILQASGLSKQFLEGPQPVDVLQGVDLAVQPGQTLAIVGASGSGKSTLLHLLGGLDAPTAGRVMLAGRDLHAMSAAAQGDWRNRHLGFVYQFHHLLPEFSALDNVAMPLLIRRQPLAEAREQAQAMLARVGLAARVTHRPAELSGGERQRVAVARALVTRPACVLADEPTGNLDTHRSREIMELITRLNRDSGITVLMVTHEPDMAAYARRIVRFVDGRVAEDRPNDHPVKVPDAPAAAEETA